MTAIPTSATGGFNQPHKNQRRRLAPTRGARTRPLPRRNYCPGAFARWRAVADPHWSPPQELRAATWIELVGMRATALRAHLLNSALSVAHSGACFFFDSARSPHRTAKRQTSRGCLPLAHPRALPAVVLSDRRSPSAMCEFPFEWWGCGCGGPRNLAFFWVLYWALGHPKETGGRPEVLWC